MGFLKPSSPPAPPTPALPDAPPPAPMFGEQTVAGQKPKPRTTAPSFIGSAGIVPTSQLSQKSLIGSAA